MKHLLFFAFAFALPLTIHAQELPLGSPLPLASQTFSAADGATGALSSMVGTKGTVFVFWSNKCAFVDRYEARLMDLAARYSQQGYRFVLVNSSNPAKDANESAEKAAARAAEKAYTMPYVLDTDGAFAKALGAARAPQVFVFDANSSLVYVGAIDDSPADAATASSYFLRDALDAVGSGKTPATTRSEALGCLIRF